MGSFCASFGKSQTTDTTQQQQQASQQSGQTTSNFMPQLQQAYSTLRKQYSNLGNMGANPWQTGAADAQMDVAGNLQPAYGAAGQVAQGGIGDVSRYMSPYISNVVDATRADFAAQNARDLSNVNAQAARTGALTGTGAAAARNQAMESQRRTQDATIANLYNQGFQQSGQLAQADASARLAGANSIGSLTGVNSGANATLGSLGQGIFQSNLAPYTLASQYAAGTAGLAGAAGSSYTGTSNGTSFGTSNTNQQQIPGAGTVAMGLLGAGMMMLPGGGGRKDGGRVDNSPSITERYHQTLADLHRASKSLGGGMLGGGNKDEPFSPVNVQWQAMTIPEMHKSIGGGAEGWAAGTTVTPEPADMSKWNSAGAYLMRQSGLQSGQRDSSFAPVNVQWMPMTRPQMADGGSVRHYADGGFADPDDNGPGAERTTSIQSRPTVGTPYEAPTETFSAPRMDLGGQQTQSPSRPGDYLRQWLPGLNEGVWVGKTPTSTQRLGAALTQIGWDNPFAGVGKSTFDQFNSEDQRRMQRDELAKRLAMDSARLAQEARLASGIGADGKPTVSLQQLQEMVRHHQAQEGQTRFSPLPEKSRGVLDTKTGQITGTPTEDRAQDRFNESYAKEHAPKNYDQAVANYATAAESAETFRALSDLAPYAKTGYTGPVPPEAMLTVRKMAASLGLANPESIGPTELFKFLSQKGVFGITSQLKPASNLDVLMAEKATASMQSDPSTLPLALPVLKRIEERKMLYQKGMMNYLRRGVAVGPEDLEQLVKSIDKQLPLVDMSGQAGAIDSPAGGPRVTKPVTDRLGQQPGQAQPEAPPQAQGWTPEDLAAARPGQKTPNGKLIMGRDGKLHPVTGPAGSETNPHEIGLFSGPTLKDGEYAVWNGKLYQQRGSGFGSLVPVERQ